MFLYFSLSKTELLQSFNVVPSGQEKYLLGIVTLGFMNFGLVTFLIEINTHIR